MLFIDLLPGVLLQMLPAALPLLMTRGPRPPYRGWGGVGVPHLAAASGWPADACLPEIFIGVWTHAPDENIVSLMADNAIDLYLLKGYTYCPSDHGSCAGGSIAALPACTARYRSAPSVHQPERHCSRLDARAGWTPASLRASMVLLKGRYLICGWAPGNGTNQRHRPDSHDNSTIALMKSAASLLKELDPNRRPLRVLKTDDGADAIPAIGTPGAPVTLFPPGARAANSSYPGGYKAFRIPAIIADGQLVLAFAEGRQFGCECSTSPKQICSKDLVLRRRPEGYEWSELIVAVAAASIPGGDKRDGLWNPSPVFDRETGTLLLVFNRSPWSLNTERDLEISPYARETWMASSSDRGLSFGMLRNLTYLQHRTETWYSVSPGGGAIQLDDGTIVVPGYHVVNRAQPVEGPFFGHTLLSSDSGRSWRRGGLEPIGVDENAAVPLRAAGGAPCVGRVCPGSKRVLINARNDGNCTGALPPGMPPPPPASCQLLRRVQVISNSGGEDWGSRKIVPSLPEITPTCGGLSRWGAMILYSGVATTKPKDRANVTLFISTDDAVEYKVHRLLHEGASGYSSVTVVPNRADSRSVDALCLFELGGISVVRVGVSF